MIKRVDFIHQKIKYSFNWNQDNHKEKIKECIKHRELFKKLELYFNAILQGKLPNQLFNSKDIQRISQFKIVGVKSPFLSSFSKNLIKSGAIKSFGHDYKLSNYVKNVYKSFKDNEINKIPRHDSVLKNILIRDRDSIAIEVPIWKKINNNFITGHIDLIQFDLINEIFKVVDYKPEGKFILSLPQVASYGLLIKKIFHIDQLRCISFNKSGAWEYDPEVLLSDISDYLKSHGINAREWEKYL